MWIGYFGSTSVHIYSISPIVFFFRWLYIISHFYISRHISRHVLHLLNTAGAGRFADDAHWHGVADRADGSGPRRCAAAGWAWQWRPRCHMGRTCGTACSRQHLRFLSMLSDIQQSSQSRENTCDLGLASATRIGQRFSEVKNMNQAWYFQAVHYLSDWCHPLV